MDSEFKKLNRLVGKRITNLRIAKNLTQKDLSKLTNISINKINKIEENGINSLKDFFKISAALGTTPYELIKGIF